MDIVSREVCSANTRDGIKVLRKGRVKFPLRISLKKTPTYVDSDNKHVRISSSAESLHRHNRCNDVLKVLQSQIDEEETRIHIINVSLSLTQFSRGTHLR